MSTPPVLSQVQRARTLLRPARATPGGLFDWSRVCGRVVEVSEAGFFGALSALCSLLVQVQGRQELVAWVSTGPSVFFPPDLAFRGVDVEALPVVQAPDPRAGLSAADALLRSGAFGLIVVDWTGGAIEEGLLGRLARVAEDRQTALVFLTRKKETDPSVATQVSLRGVVGLTEGGETAWRIIKDKQSGPPEAQRMAFRGPFGLY